MIKLHLFEMDNTLAAVNYDSAWKEYLVKAGLAPETSLASSAAFQESRSAGRLFDSGEFLKFQLAEFKGNTKPDMLKIAFKFFEEVVKPAIKQSAFDYIKSIIRAGGQVAILTSTNNILAYHTALYFGITDYIGTDPDADNGFFTGTAAKLYPYAESKLFYLGRLCERYNFDASEVAVYTSSMLDLPLLNTAGRPVVVDPCDNLAQYAEGHNWEILNWQN